MFEMAVARTVLPRKGLVQLQQGTAYEADIDTDLLVFGTNVMYSADPVEVALAPSDVGNFTVVHGFNY